MNKQEVNDKIEEMKKKIDSLIEGKQRRFFITESWTEYKEKIQAAKFEFNKFLLDHSPNNEFLYRCRYCPFRPKKKCVDEKSCKSNLKKGGKDG